jgi:arylformamidase
MTAARQPVPGGTAPGPDAAGWMDLSVAVRPGMPCWPGNPPVLMERPMAMERGDDCNLTRLDMGVHSGTHVDAPVHFIPGGAGADQMPLATGIGPARVIEIEHENLVTADELERHELQSGERILLKTANSPRCWRADGFVADYVYLTEDAARHLAGARVALVGVDYLSVGGYGTDIAAVHEILLGSGVWIIEGLDLSPVTAGRWELVCLPIRLAGCDGAPARVAARPLP